MFEGIERCESCYPFTLAACPASDQSITIKAGLPAATGFYWYLQDKHEKIYGGFETTNGSGDFAIPLTDFPEGFFNPHAGAFIIWLEVNPYTPNAQTLTFSTVEYECINLNFQESGIENPIYTIQ